MQKNHIKPISSWSQIKNIDYKKIVKKSPLKQIKLIGFETNLAMKFIIATSYQ